MSKKGKVLTATFCTGILLAAVSCLVAFFHYRPNRLDRLNDNDCDFVNCHPTERLGRLKKVQDIIYTQDECDAAEFRWTREHDRVLVALDTVLAMGEVEERKTAISILPHLHPSDRFAPLDRCFAQLESPYIEIQWSAINALYSLIRALPSDSTQLRACSMRILQMLQDPQNAHNYGALSILLTFPAQQFPEETKSAIKAALSRIKTDVNGQIGMFRGIRDTGLADDDMIKHIVSFLNVGATPEWAIQLALDVLRDIRLPLSGAELDSMAELLNYPSREIVRQTLRVFTSASKLAIGTRHVLILQEVAKRYWYDDEIVKAVDAVKQRSQKQ